MRFLERRADRHRPAGPGLIDPGTSQDSADLRPREPAALPPVTRTDLTTLLGRTVLEVRVQQVCREYGLVPRSGTSVGSGLSRAYLARDAGVELAADAYGLVTTVFLHFHGGDGYTPYEGEIPGGAGSVPRRTHLWATLGHPEERGEAYRDRVLGDYGPWDRWVPAGFALHARYAVDGENLDRVTLTLPERRPGRL